MTAWRTSVVVYNHLVALPVAFTRSENHSSGIFQHRNQIRHHKRLGKQIFRSAVQARTLPTPFIPVVPIHFSMTLPHGHMPSFQSPADFKRMRHIGHPRVSLRFQFTVQASLVLFLPERIRHQVLNQLSVCIHLQGIIIYRSRKRLLQQTIDGRYIFFRKRLVTKSRIGIHAQYLLFMFQLHAFQLTLADIRIRSLIIGKKILQTLLRGLLQTLSKHCPCHTKTAQQKNSNFFHLYSIEPAQR